MGDAIWTKNRPDGKVGEIFHVGVACGRAELVVKIDGREVARGAFLPINRGLPGHKNAPKGVSHLIGAFCLLPADGDAVAAIVAGLDAAIAKGISEKAEVRVNAHWSKLEAMGVTREQAETVLNRWGRDGLQNQRAWEAGAIQDHAILEKMDVASL